MDKFRVFGIRHHGPGSANSLIKALSDYAPEVILIEGPTEADSLISYVADPDLIPPVAMLIYNPKVLHQAAYLPFASFSPEWQAIVYGLKNNRPIHFIDLPMGIQMALTEEEQGRNLFQENQQANKDIEVIRDPLGFLGRLAGYKDGERWWEVAFEQQEHDENIFQTILEMMRSLREELNRVESKETLYREAHMRKLIRKHIKTHNRTAIICGAWHAPVLDDVLKIPAKQDNTLLKGLKKIKVKTTWIPWSYDRLAYRSGYGAGVLAPAWYEYLFSDRTKAHYNWMTQVGRLLREEGLDNSSAHVLEAVRLAETLATLRRQTVPGITELQEAAMTIFSDGDEKPLEFIQQQLITGNEIGQVPSRIMNLPLQQDLEKQIRSTRLKKYWETTIEQWLKASAKNPTGGIDLRDPTDLDKSHLLRRLNMININWGTFQEPEGGLGGFKEHWKMQWQPEFALHIIEAAMYGNTVYDAALNKVLEKAKEAEDLPTITQLVDEVLKADLQEAVGPLIQKMQEFAAQTKDAYLLMLALPPLVNIIRYGSTRKMEVNQLQLLADQLIPRIAIALPGAVSHIEEEYAQQIFTQILQVNRSIHLLNNQDHQKQWYQTLTIISENEASHKLIQGGALRVLFEKQECNLREVTTAMRLALSPANPVLDVAYWIEGFLHGSGLLLIYNPQLWSILDNWISQLKEEAFMEILPLLRRTFANFPPPERQKMLELAKADQLDIPEETEAMNVSNNRAALVKNNVRKLLGIG